MFPALSARSLKTAPTTLYMDNNPTSRADYIRKILAAYRQTPGTTGLVHHHDRLFAANLFQRRIPLAVVENALLLGTVRRLYRDLDAPPLPPVRSLRYFASLIEEVLTLKVSPLYFQYLRHQIDTFEQAKQRFLLSRRT